LKIKEMAEQCDTRVQMFGLGTRALIEDFGVEKEIFPGVFRDLGAKIMQKSHLSDDRLS
jgi:hypothetical protein